MLKTGLRAALVVALVLGSTLAACSKGSPVDTTVQAIDFETQAIPAGGAGQLYNVVIRFATEGGAALPDRFELRQGVLPPGVTLARDREDTDLDGLPDEDGAYTGFARLLGFPREPGSYSFTIQAISTGALGGLAQNLDQPDLAATAAFTINVGEGSVTILNPTAAEGTSDPAILAFPDVIDFVNPANPNAFFSYAFNVAGGSGDNLLDIFLPRELELSVFDAAVAAGGPLSDDLDESAGSGDKFSNDFSDGGLFVLQAGNKKVQLGGFQSPRGPVGTITSLDPDWFQSPAVPKSSRRDLADTQGLSGGDTTLGTPLPVQFSDYFDAGYEGTHPSFTAPPGSGLSRRKYPFTADQYANAFFLPFTDGVDITPLRYRAIVQAIDTRGTPGKSDDVIFRKAYLVQVRIPDIVIDTVVLAPGQAGVDYVEFVNASGGVPPLRFDLEGVDGTQNLALDTGDPLDKDLFGLEMDPNTGQFFGVPRASSAGAGSVEITVRVFAAVMNPTQNGPAPIPTGTAGEFDGLNLDTGKRGRHKTFPVFVALPTAPAIANTSLVPGVDGLAYPGDRVTGTGGVARLVPYPVGFTSSTYPSSQASRNFAWSVSYVKDASHGGDEGTTAPGLPNALTLDGDPLSATNGQISGTPFDRGFHPVNISGADFYAGDAGAPSATAFQQGFGTVFTLSISPDETVYLRGRQTGEGSGGEKTGLLDPTIQMGETRMVPMILAASLYTVETGKQPSVYVDLPAQVDILPVMLPNGGSDAHNRKAIPSISGFWPAESNKESGWYGFGHRAWQHQQQEMTWLQANNASHHRVYLWAETVTKKWSSSATSGGHAQRYQQYKSTGKRGVIVADPLSGDFWVPAILDNNSSVHGTQFGAEVVIMRANDRTYGVNGTGYWKYYYYGQTDTRWDREVHLQGLGSYIEIGNYGGSSRGWYRTSQGRTATSVAMSADGVWCATAMPGGSEQKVLLWRTDKQPIPAAITGRSFVDSLTGKYKDGSDFPDSACIVNLGGELDIPVSQSYLLPDSLMFVDSGLLFLMQTRMSTIYGLSLVDGHLSSKDVNTRTAVNGAGTGPTANSTDGMYVPDQDYLRGLMAQSAFSVQFAFSGSEPAAGATGPAKVAFVAGDNKALTTWTDLSGQPRDGYLMQGNRNKALLVMDLATGAGGLELGSSTIYDITGNDPDVYGDLLTPGRPGEEQDNLVLSPDGKYVAVVRDNSTSEYSTSFSLYVSTFATGNYSSSNWAKNDDLIVASTDGSDMDANVAGTQHVLYVGSDSFSNDGGDPAGMPSYASGKGYLNAYYRRVLGIQWAEDSESLFFTYSGHNRDFSNPPYYNPGYTGGSNSWGVNPSQTGTFSMGVSQLVRMDLKTAAGGAIKFSSETDKASFLKNALVGLPGIPAIGDTTVDFGKTNSSEQLFWATFKSDNGKFLYYVCDQISTRNHMVGFNIGSATINGRAPFVPFSPHASGVGFEQFDVNSWGYENRFAGSPGGVSFGGRDAGGILCVIANDASGGATNATDLEVYAFDANIGGDFVALTSDVTNGSANAINYLYLSADGNVLVGQRAATTANSRDARASLTGTNDLFAVTNVHAALAGATPNAFLVSADASHGSSVAFVGEGTKSGPQAIVFSKAAKGSGQTWDDRTLQVAVLAPGVVPNTIDNTRSHYAILVAGRNLADDPTDSD